MVQFYKKAVIAMAVTLASSSNVFALGLGEVSWKSTLNQPLNAEIALYDVKNVTNAELTVELADPDAFEKAGLERPFFLTDLVFTPVIKNGKGYIKVTSNNPIKEPYLDFLLSVSWSSGKTLREYTLLIDPPTYTPKKVIATIAPREPVEFKQPVKKVEPKISTQVKPVSVNKTESKTNKAISSASQDTGNKIGSGNVKVVTGDSLWNIAAKTRGNASIHQAMLSIYQENPDAFIDGDMSRLKRGKVLRIPNTEQMRTQTRSEALANVLQNVNSKGKATRQIAASNNSVNPTPAKPVVDALTLVAPQDNKADSTNQIGQVSNRLMSDLSEKRTQAEENLDAINRKNEELRSRMEDLQSQLSSIKGIIQLRDNQLANLQANIAKRQQAKPSLIDNQEPTDSMDNATQSPDEEKTSIQ